MKHVSSDNFGFLIAYIIPGFALVWGLRLFVPELDSLLGMPISESQSIGSFLSMTVASIGIGMMVSTVRWLLVDTLHHATGIPQPHWDFSQLKESPEAFTLVVEHYYRYFQFHANAFVSLLLVFLVRRWSLGFFTSPWHAADLGLLALMAVLFVGSRDSLRRYYTRGGQLLRTPPKRRGRTGARGT